MESSDCEEVWTCLTTSQHLVWVSRLVHSLGREAISERTNAVWQFTKLEKTQTASNLQKNPTGSPCVLQPLCQGNSKSLDVVCHFLRAGLTLAQWVWEKTVWKGQEEVFIYLCWWGTISTLIRRTPLPGLLCDELNQRVRRSDIYIFCVKDEVSRLWNRSRRSKTLLSDYLNGDKTDLAQN